MVLAESFYVEVMEQLVVAFGAALVVGNLLAIFKKRPVPTPAPSGANAKAVAHPSSSEPGAHVAMMRAPLWRSLLFVALGLVMLVWGIASLMR